MPLPEAQRAAVLEREERAKALAPGDVAFLIPARWWKEWKRYAGYPSPVPKGTPTGPPPDRLDTSELLKGGGLSAGPGDVSSEPELRPKLREGEDYAIVRQATWQILVEWYGGGPPIPRYAIQQKGSTQCTVEVYPWTLDVLREQDMQNPTTVTISVNATVEELKEKACSAFDLKPDDCRLWDYYKASKYAKLTDMTLTLEAARLIKGQQVLVEERNSDGKFEEVPEEETGRSYGTSTSPMALGFGGSGSFGRSSYSFSSPFASRTYTDEITLAQNGQATGKRGKTGLTNLGNTCFMNSGLQCLSHSPLLVPYFLSDKYEEDINETNPIGLGGELARSFGTLCNMLWREDATSVTPRGFKAKLARFAPQFTGYNQQDSQELLIFLLDGLHEDLNRVRDKPYVENKDSNGRPDDVVALEYWENHRRRNDSHVVDIFQGQYKSTLVCPNPDCRHTSVTFDTFMYLTVQLPGETTQQFRVTVVWTDGSRVPTTFGVKVPKVCTADDVVRATAAAARLGDDESVVLARSQGHNQVDKVYADPTEALTALRTESTLYAFQMSKEQASSSRWAVVYHRRMMKRTSGYYTSAEYWQQFGTPLVLPFPPALSHEGAAQLATAVETALKPFAKPQALDRSEPEHAEEQSSNSEMASASSRMDVSVDGEAPDADPMPLFELRKTNAHGFASNGAFGAEEQRSLVSSVVGAFTRGSYSRENVEYVAADWNAAELDRFYDRQAMERQELDSSLQDLGDSSAGVTLYDCFDAYMQEERLGTDDLWYCPKCKDHVQATKKLDLYRMPRLLVVNIKRFQYNRMFRDKLDTLVDFPITGLDLSPYVVGSAPDVPLTYDLYAVSNHFGGLGGGHYTAYAYHEDERAWYNFDDAHVSRVSESELKSSAAYVLFYRRSDTWGTDGPLPMPPEVAAHGNGRGHAPPADAEMMMSL